jgi:2-keto-3-deoxy-L-rhamnonate aldolase RhmA
MGSSDAFAQSTSPAQDPSKDDQGFRWTAGRWTADLRRAQENDDVVCIMIVESLAGKENLPDILSVDGVTGIAIGPGDISLELGGLAWNDPQVESVLADMAASVKATPDRALLRLAQSAEEAAANVAGGANMLILTHDVTLIRGLYAEQLAKLRGRAMDAFR